MGLLGTHLLLLLISKAGLYEIGIKVNFFNIAMPFIMGILSILIAVYNSAKLGSMLSPIEAMSTDRKIRKNQAHLHGPMNRLILLVYGQMGKLSVTNIGRYKKSFFATIITISVSIALFISVFYMAKGLEPIQQIRGKMTADFVLKYETNKDKNGYGTEVIKRIREIQGIEQINPMKQMFYYIDIGTDYLTNEGKKYFEEEAKSDDYIKELLSNKKIELVCYAVGLDEKNDELK
jgi:putative ABC transport system permease protein